MAQQANSMTLSSTPHLVFCCPDAQYPFLLELTASVVLRRSKTPGVMTTLREARVSGGFGVLQDLRFGVVFFEVCLCL